MTEKPELEKLFAQGYKSSSQSLPPSPSNSPGKAHTTLNSRWLGEKCPVCLHTFRLGDEVYIAPTGEVTHHSSSLPCTPNPEAPPETEIRQFFQGLDAAWPPLEALPLVRLEGKHPLLAPPQARFGRHTCAVCTHTLRPRDQVVICPCNPQQPQCNLAVHRDSVHQLYCLEAWNPTINAQNYCPITSRRL